jgi:thiamine biosynthesis protein ThiI
LDVDLDAPDRELHVEARDRRAFLFESALPGPGGFPVGSQGKVGAVVSHAADAAAVWLVMKRGCAVIAAGDETRIAALERWAPSIRRLRGGEDGTESEVESMFRRGAEAVVTGAREPGPSPMDARGSRRLLLQPLVGLSDGEIAAIVSKIDAPP